MPVGVVEKLSSRVLHGPNRWSRLPVVHLRVSLGDLDASPTDRIPGFTDRLMSALPGLAQHGCSAGRPGGFESRLNEGTWVGHVVEHVALELQRAVGAATTRGKTRGAGPPGIYDVVFAFEDEAVGLAAGDAAIELVNGLIEAPSADAVGVPSSAAMIAALQALSDRSRLAVSTQAIVDAARRRDIPVRRLDERNLVQLGWGVHARRVRATVASDPGPIGAEHPRDEGGAVVDRLFAPGSEGRIPVAAVTGSNGKTTTVRLLAHLLQTSGLAVGYTTTHDVVAAGLVLRTGDMAGPSSARLLLSTPTIEAAVLEVARGGILRDGLGYDHNDVAVVTNVTGDHLGLGGIETLDQLADVKAVIVDAVPRSGTAVLNADDPLVLAMAERCRGSIALTTMRTADDPGALAVAHHLAAGGLGGRVEWTDGEERLVIRRGSDVVVSRALAGIPLTLGGAARMHVANALAAACAAVALGVSGDIMERALGAFASSPGRVERHVLHGRETIIDYGHNIGALRGLKEMIVRIAEDRRVIGVVSMPGDRRDEDHVVYGALAGTIFDTLFIAEPAVRGRPVGEAAQLLMEAASRTEDGRPSRAGSPTFLADEADAACAALCAADADDLIVLCVADAPRVMARLEWCPSRSSRSAQLATPA